MFSITINVPFFDVFQQETAPGRTQPELSEWGLCWSSDPTVVSSVHQGPPVQKSLQGKTFQWYFMKTIIKNEKLLANIHA